MNYGKGGTLSYRQNDRTVKATEWRPYYLRIYENF